MDPTEKTRSVRKWVASAALVASGLIAGGILAGTSIAGAQSATTSPSATALALRAPRDPAAHGPGETLLTGTTAAKVKAAALKAVPGGTVERLETDSEGSPYEAHVQKADGTHVVVKVDKAFKVTGIETCNGHRPSDTTATSTSTTSV